MVKQFALAQVNSDLFPVMRRTVATAIHWPVIKTTTAAVEFVAMVSVQLHVEIRTIVLTVNIAQTIDA